MPKSFIPEKDLSKNVERMLKEAEITERAEIKIGEALKDYAGRREYTHILRVPELVAAINRIDINVYIKRLTTTQLEGKTPLLRILSTPENLTAVTYDLYWNPKNKSLEFDWDDTPGAWKRWNSWSKEVR